MPPITEKPSSSVPWALVGLSLTMLMPSLDTSIANAGLPALAHAFTASFQSLQWIVLSYLLAITTLIVSVGRLGDMFGRRRLLLGGIAVFTLASLLCGMAPALWLLLASRAIQGLGAAIMMSLTIAVVGDTVPKDKAGSAMGLLGTMSAVGTALGPSLGGVLIAGFGWRMIFLVNVPIGLINLYLAWRHLPSDVPSGKGPEVSVDLPGTLTLATTLAAYALAMTLGHGHLGWRNAMLLAVAVMGVGLFVVVEVKTASPLIQPETFRLPGLSTGLALSALVATVVMATLVVGPFYLSRGLGLSPAVAGLILSIGPVVAALTGIPAGFLVDRFGAPRMTVIGLTGIALGCLILTRIQIRFGVPGYVLPIALTTASYALFQAANTVAIMMNLTPGKRGVISGMLSLSRNLGLITGASFLGAVFTKASATSDVTTASPDAVLSGVHVTFAVAGALIFAGLSLAISRLVRQTSRKAVAHAHLPES